MIGQKISHYEITEHLSSGAMGDVYKAEDVTLGRTVAIKVIRPTHRDPRVANKRFLREARAVSQIDHKNVVTVFDVVQKGDVNFMVMQYVQGASLRERMSEAPIELADALRMTCDIVEGLDAAHKQRVVHRDIKPVPIPSTGSPSVS